MDDIPSQGIEICLLEAALKRIINKKEFLEKLYQIETEFLIPSERLIEIEKYFELNGG